MLGLTHRCDVYTESAGGLFDTLVKTSLVCRFVPIGEESIVDRGLPNQSRKLLFDASYDMPANAQVERDGQRWNTHSDTLLPRELGARLHHRRVTVVLAADD